MIGSTSAPADAGGADSLRPALLDVTVNGQRGAEPVPLLEGPDGTLYASSATFAAWRLRLPTVRPVRFEGEDYYAISRVPAVRVVLHAEQQAVAIEAPASAFEVQRTALDPFADLPMTPPASGGFLDYDLLLEHARGDTIATGAAEFGLFTRYGVGQTGFVGTVGSGYDTVVRLETSWSIDRPSNATSIRIGDSISSAGPGAAPVRFAGIQFFRNYAVRPGFITMPLPTAVGDAAVPSVVDIYVNNVLQGSREVAPGPFELADIPVQSGGGTVQLVVRDLLGRQVVSEQSYYASTQMLRSGLHVFSYDAGFVRRGFGRRSNGYGAFMASTTHRYGLSDRITAEGHVQASEARQMAGAALSLLAFDLGQLGASASVSRSERGTGYRLATSFERRVPGLSFGLLGEYHSAGYAVIGMPDGYRAPRLTLQGFTDLPLRRGSIGMNLLHRSLRGDDDETLAGLFGTYQVSDRAVIHLYARHAVAGTRQTALGGHLSFAFGGRRSAFVAVEHRRGGIGAHVSLQESPPVGVGGGWRAEASLGRFDRAEAAYVHNLPMAAVGAQLAHAEGSTGLRLSARGSAGLIGGDLFAARDLGASFARVRLDGYPGVRVYADEQLIGVTGADGSIVVPALRAFEPNRIRIDETDLPLDAQVATNEITLRPYARAGSEVRFPIRAERGVLLQLRREDGSDVPAGAVLSVEGMDGEFVVVSGGAAYVPDLAGRRRLSATWEGGRCSALAEVPAGDDPQPRLGIVCSAEQIYATR